MYTKRRDFGFDTLQSSPTLPFELHQSSPYLGATDLGLEGFFGGPARFTVSRSRRCIQHVDFENLERSPSLVGALVIDSLSAGARLVANDEGGDVLVGDGRAVGIGDAGIIYGRGGAGGDGEEGHADEVAVWACGVVAVPLSQWGGI